MRVREANTSLRSSWLPSRIMPWYGARSVVVTSITGYLEEPCHAFGEIVVVRRIARTSAPIRLARSSLPPRASLCQVDRTRPARTLGCGRGDGPPCEVARGCVAAGVAPGSTPNSRSIPRTMSRCVIVRCGTAAAMGSSTGARDPPASASNAAASRSRIVCSSSMECPNAETMASIVVVFSVSPASALLTVFLSTPALAASVTVFSPRSSRHFRRTSPAWNTDTR